MKIYDDLKKLTESDYSFYSSIQITPDGMPVEIFCYRVAPESAWELESARECRGIMFELDSDYKPVKILSRPMEKFFNINENKFSKLSDKYEDILYFTPKHDGSLISTYIDKNGGLRLKSKGSLNSEQAAFANRYILRKELKEFRDALHDIAKNGYTVDLEYVGPSNRIVLFYSEPSLKVLSIRNNETGEYILPHEFLYNYLAIGQHTSEIYGLYEKEPNLEYAKSVIEAQKTEQNVEGYIYVMKSGERLKLKTDWYFELHSTKDMISSPKKLVTSVINGSSDDLKSLFDGDNETINYIRQYEEKLAAVTIELIDITKRVTNQLAGLTDAAGAGLAQTLAVKENRKWHKLIFSLVMSYRRHTNTELLIEIIYKFVKRNPEDFGFE